MAKQTFTTGQVLTAAQMTSLQDTAMGGGNTTAKTASYVLVAADAGTVVAMNAAGATTITVNTALFAAGDTVTIQNRGAGVCTVTAGTATVVTAGSLALAQNEGGILYFTATGAATFYDYVQTSGASGKVLQVVSNTYSTETSVTGETYGDTGLTATITPTAATSTILVLVNQPLRATREPGTATFAALRLLRGATTILTPAPDIYQFQGGGTFSTNANLYAYPSMHYLDSPATTSATTYKTQQAAFASNTSVTQSNAAVAVMTLLEIGA
jgi:hypothetical protein